MLLAIDIGNTRDKFAVFDNDEMVCCSVEIKRRFDDMKRRFTDTERRFADVKRPFILTVDNTDFTISDCVFCSVKDKNADEYFISIIREFCPVQQISITSTLPFKNNYQSNTLGIDRICGIAGAQYLYGNKTLVIDAGTCITFDYIDGNNTYLGGSISPGIHTKYAALHNFTANLPLVNTVRHIELLENTTQGCIASGVINGTIAEVNQMIKNYKKMFGDINVVLTGGDGEFIKNELQCEVFLEKNLVLWGLKNIYEFNVETNS